MERLARTNWSENAGPRTHISRSDVKTGDGPVSGASRPCRRSPPFTPRSITTFHQDRHRNRRNVFKQNRSAALAEWRQLAAWDLCFPTPLETGSHWTDSTD